MARGRSKVVYIPVGACHVYHSGITRVGADSVLSVCVEEAPLRLDSVFESKVC